MISAMPAVALRRGRDKGPQWKPDGKTMQPPALVEYYNNKISKLGHFPPSRRTYSTSTSLQSPDTEGGHAFPYDEDYYDVESAGRCRRCCRRFTLFHVGCLFLGGGLFVLFISVGSIKGDVTPLRATGSSLVVFGALLCLIWTSCFRRPEPILIGLRSSDSFVSRTAVSATGSGPDSLLLTSHGATMEELIEEDDDDVLVCSGDAPATLNGGIPGGVPNEGAKDVQREDSGEAPLEVPEDSETIDAPCGHSVQDVPETEVDGLLTSNEVKV